MTPLGEELLEIAQRIEVGFDDLDRRIVGKDILPKGLVRITAPNNLAYRFLPVVRISNSTGDRRIWMSYLVTP